MNGLNLLNRFETRFECSEKTAQKIKNKLDSTTTYKQNDSLQRISDLIFLPKTPYELSCDKSQIRAYYLYSLGEIDTLWIERRITKNNKIMKSRKHFIENVLYKHNLILRRLELLPAIFIDYQRTSFDNKKQQIRISFDEDIRYYKLHKQGSRFKHGNLIGKEKFCLITIKYSKKMPNNLINLFKKLKKGKPIINNATKLLTK